MMLRHMDSAAALKCIGYGFESSLAGHLDKGSVHWRGARYVNVWGRHTGSECRLGAQVFLFH